MRGVVVLSSVLAKSRSLTRFRGFGMTHEVFYAAAYSNHCGF
jgi:hypothetical protein